MQSKNCSIEDLIDNIKWYDRINQIVYPILLLFLTVLSILSVLLFWEQIVGMGLSDASSNTCEEDVRKDSEKRGFGAMLCL